MAKTTMPMIGWALAGELDSCFKVLRQLDHLHTRLPAPNKAIQAGASEATTHQTLTCSRWQHPQQQDPQGEPGNVEQPGEDLDDKVDPDRPPAWDDAQEDGPEREHDHEGDGRNNPVGGAAFHGGVVVEARPVPKPEAAAVAIAIAITAAAAAVARVAATGTPTIRAAASPAAELGKRWVDERGCLDCYQLLPLWREYFVPEELRSPIANAVCVALFIIYIVFMTLERHK